MVTKKAANTSEITPIIDKKSLQNKTVESSPYVTLNLFQWKTNFNNKAQLLTLSLYLFTTPLEVYINCVSQRGL